MQEGTVKFFNETKGFLADSTLFQILTYDFIEGNPETALMNPNSLVLSEEIAKRSLVKNRHWTK